MSGISAIRGQLYAAITKSMVSRYAVYGANALSLMILARIFSPETFGVTASLSTLLIFFQMLAEGGLTPAIISISRVEEKDRDGIFGFTLIIGAVLGLLFYACSPIISEFYRMNKVGVVAPYAAMSLFFYASTIFPSAILLREQQFVKIAISGVASELVSTMVAVCLAFYSDPLHALAAKSFISAGTNFVLLYYFSGFTTIGRAKVAARLSAIKILFPFSNHQFGFNFLNYFTRNLDNILVARYFGAVSLGVYDKAYQLMRYPLMLLTFAMAPALQPVIAKHANDVDAVEAIHRDFTFKISLAGALAGLTIFIFSQEIVLILLGEKWGEVASIIKVLAIAIPVQIVLSTSGSFFQAMNRADLLLKCGLFSSAITVGAIFWGVREGDLTELAWAIVVAFHVNFVQAYYLLYRRILMKGFSDFMLRMLPAACSVASMAAIVLF